MKGRCHTSYTAIADFFQDILQITISRGFLVKQIMKATRAMDKSYEYLRLQLVNEGHLNIDETGWKENGEKRWIWAFRAKKYAVFVIEKSRATEVLIGILGQDFDGIISCDFYGAYRKFKRLTSGLLQFCWAHLIREILFLQGLTDAAVVRYAKRILKQVARMFETIHAKDDMPIEAWKEEMHECQELIVKRVSGTVPNHQDAQNIAKRFKQWETDYFRFIDAELEPTNNMAELTVRQCVLDRVVTQGSRSARGNEWHERFWTIFTTCHMQNVSVMHYLKNCLQELFGIPLTQQSIILSSGI
jgi:hypothetical protein